jgi:phytoene dehydrogenase-like protein
MTEAAPVVVVGAGHNGLACSAYLARAGRRVLVLEALDRVGGAAVTREFAPGFRAPAVAHLAWALDPVVIRDLDLPRHGLAFAGAPLKTVALGGPGDNDNGTLVLDGPQIVKGAVTDRDRATYPVFLRRHQRFAAALARQHGRVPPRLAWERWRDALPAAGLALDLRRLGAADLREFLRVAPGNIHDLLDGTFDTPLLKGALALDAVLGTHAGPRSGNTVLTWLHRLGGRPMLPRGGMGAVSDALAAAARAAGAEIRTGSPVAAILMDGDRIGGVRLAGGEEIAAAVVVSATDPKTTLLQLLGARHLEAGFAQRVHHVRATGTAAKLHLALDGAPAFTGVAPEELGERLLVAPDPDYVERAFNPVKYRGFSAEPVLEITVPTARDATLAPAGKHVLSAIVQYAPLHPADGAAAGAFREAVLDVLERHAPGLRRRVVAAELLLPADLERGFNLTGGHWHHGELALDQFLMLRPVPGAARYATPVPGLYLCSAGCHPGGGVMGTAGRNAAGVILAGGRP